eukprot:Lithocolla_globosa_v1_NODE_324_length_4471_cov_1015.959466.p3 type:complete len:131 gc:universal NODE_324_length_4471_cov_1015.959466:4214-3822(-)
MGIYNTNSQKIGSVGVFNDDISVPLVPQIQLHYTYNINTRITDETTNGTASSSTNNGLLSLSTGTTTASDIEITSHRTAKYYPGQGLLCRFTALFPSVLNGTSFVEIGMGNSCYIIFSKSRGIFRRGTKS